jgi:multiple sugar transport system permease protein
MSSAGAPRMVGAKKGAGASAGVIARWIALCIAAVVFLIPFYLLIRNALGTNDDIGSTKFFPSSPQWHNFTDLFTDSDIGFGRAMANSAIIAVVQTSVSLVISAMAGYGLARIPYKHANKIFYLIVAALMIPGAVTFVPSFVLISALNWLETLKALIVPGLFSGFATFLFRQFFLQFPKELEEAARVDGVSYWGAFWRIVAPNSLAFSSALAVIGFIGSWNAFLWPLVVAGNSPTSYTVQVAMSSFLTAQTQNYPELFMAALVSILPLILIFIFLQRYLIRGVAETGIKG